MSWMGTWDWESNANGEKADDKPPVFASYLGKKKKPIEISTRYKALEPEDEEEEDRKSDHYADTDDEELGNMPKPEDPVGRAL